VLATAFLHLSNWIVLLLFLLIVLNIPFIEANVKNEQDSKI